jgi:C_GCAxxG_C_C family probable redox protein
MDTPDQARHDFEAGFNCAQSVLASFAPRYGLDRDMALRLGTPFGAGMARQGRTCGAVTGGLMAIGLRHGRVRTEDVEAKASAYALAQAFMMRFESAHGSLACRDLLGLDLANADADQLAEAEVLFVDRCPIFVQDVVRLLNDLGV